MKVPDFCPNCREDQWCTCSSEKEGCNCEMCLELAGCYWHNDPNCSCEEWDVKEEDFGL